MKMPRLLLVCGLSVVSGTPVTMAALHTPIYREGRQIARLLTAQDKDAEIRIDDVLRIVIIPSIKDDGRVLLSAKVFEFAGDEYVLLAEPKLITANNKEAEIRIASDSGKSFRFLITPHAD